MKRKVVWTIACLAVLTGVARGEIAEKPGSTTTGVPTRTARSDYWSDAGWGSLAVLTNLLYMPAKVVYAVLGLPTGGLGYLLTIGDTETMDRIFGASLGGTYVVTPEMLRDEEPIRFIGPTAD